MGRMGWKLISVVNVSGWIIESFRVNPRGKKRNEMMDIREVNKLSANLMIRNLIKICHRF